jgi:hypothetical protein
VDREGAAEDMSEGFVRMREAMEARLDKRRLTSLTDQLPGSGWSGPRIVENSGILYFIHVCIKFHVKES